jgi:hypothetical protein
MFGSSGLNLAFEGLLLGASRRCHEDDHKWLLTKGAQGSLRPKEGISFHFCGGPVVPPDREMEVSQCRQRPGTEDLEEATMRRRSGSIARGYRPQALGK